ncbi:MAG: hypothetical protein MPJ78_13675 [Hyphomicrobiaceae bacterium]|nr:hypothetical protein [Hyphomicrobiaceae bacterium]
MRVVAFVTGVALAGALFMSVKSSPAFAVCKTIQASHNGTDMFHETGATGAAQNKLMIKVNALRREMAPRRVRMGRVRTKCGQWFMKYLLPHKHCVAKARVCY